MAVRIGPQSQPPVPQPVPVPVAEVRHAFTHFRLRARVWQVLLPGETRLPAPAGHVWLALSEVEGAPLPRPVKTLLAGLGQRPP